MLLACLAVAAVLEGGSLGRTGIPTNLVPSFVDFWEFEELWWSELRGFLVGAPICFLAISRIIQ